MQEIKIKNVIIGRQFEDSKNLQEFTKIIKKKKINVIVADTGDRINIEKNLYFDVLFPDNSKMISENAINNNALVCKLYYRNFTCLFTGDIEEETEKVLTSKYKGTDILKSTVLKVAHHGSKSSSTEGFLNLVQPKIALIGVGENNKFGHPNSDVIKRLKNLRCENL